MSNNISVVQMTALLDFLEDHKELALGHLNRSKEGRNESRRLWETVAVLLNSSSVNCAVKNGEEWRLYFNDFKCKLMRKIRTEKNERSATGGGPAKPLILTPLQERLYTILGKDVGEPLPGVRHNPLVAEATAYSGSPGPSHDNILRLNDTGSHDEDQVMREENIELLGFETPLEQNRTEPNPMEQQQQRAEPQSRPPRDSHRRRRRRRDRSTRRSSSRQNAEQTEREPTMREAADRLERIESLNANALLVHANAINRLAAAMEAIAERMPPPPHTSRSRSPPPMPRNGLVISDSDDD